MQAMFDAEVEEIAGPRGASTTPSGTAVRHGRERGSVELEAGGWR